MPTYPLNNAATADNFTDAATTQFPVGKPHFSLQVYNAAVFYKLIAWTPPASYYVDETERYLAPVLADFDSPEGEGLAAGTLFGGIMLRSAVAGASARVTVI